MELNGWSLIKLTGGVAHLPKQQLLVLFFPNKPSTMGYGWVVEKIIVFGRARTMGPIGGVTRGDFRIQHPYSVRFGML
jgi:hypothetical protein